MRKIGLLFLYLSVISGLTGYAQISDGGIPLSFQYKLKNPIETITIAPPDLNQIAEEDAKAEEDFSPRRFSVLLPAGINLMERAQKIVLPDGKLLWRLMLKSENALAISLYFDEFQLTDNSKLFLYDVNGKQVKGAYTSSNNHESRLFATELIYGDAVVLELICDNEIELPSISISHLGYAYRDVPDITRYKGFGGSDFCEVNVGCSPEGDGWQHIKNGIVRIQIKVSGSAYWCSGTIVNNEREDNTPYLLTADHCAFQMGHYATISDLNQWLFYFNYEAQTCDNPPTEPAHKSMVGAIKVSQGGNRGTTGSDFYLLRLNQDIPSDYNPYFSGWSTVDEVSNSGVSIHHPSGDIKKISTYTLPLVTTGWFGNGLQSHWKVFWTETENGWGVTEGGSSGSSLYNEQGRLMGTLTGGSAACEDSDNYGPDDPDYYGKFSYHWLSNGTSDTAQLKPWLDPDNTGITVLDGKVLGIDQNLGIDLISVQIFPNPTSGFLNVNFINFEPSEIKLVIVDILGTVIRNIEINPSIKNVAIDLRDFPEGIYIIKIDTGQNAVMKRIIKFN
jgi:hypothetical protein